MKPILSFFALLILLSCNNSGDTASESREDVVQAEVAEATTTEATVNGLVGNSESKSKSDGSYAFTTSNAGATNNNTITFKDADKTETPQPTKSTLEVNSPKLIKNGFLTIEVENYKSSLGKIKELVLKNKGYLGNETETNETYRITNELTIRIPSTAFDQMMEGLMGEGIKTDNKKVEVQDVGEEYADLTARIEAKKAVEKRYLEILTKANKISDILEVEEKLRVIREETEAAQGRIKYLENQVSYSTIYLNFYKTLDANYTPPSGPGFFSRIWKALAKGWEGILEFLIGCTYLWPLWLFFTLVWFWVKKRHIKIWPFHKKPQP